MIVFKYKAESLGRGEGKIYRPIADVYLKTKTGDWIEFHPYIDSGADVTLLPLSLGKLVGLTMDERKIEKIGGIRGTVRVIYSDNEIKIGDYRLVVKVGWALIEAVPALLGRTDVFDAFEVIFKQKQKKILFRKR